MKKDVTLPHVIAPEHELVLGSVPDRENKIADQVVDAIRAQRR
jgi:hypothetical protein